MVVVVVVVVVVTPDWVVVVVVVVVVGILVPSLLCRLNTRRCALPPASVR